MNRSARWIPLAFALSGIGCASRPQWWQGPATSSDAQAALEARILELERAAVRQRLELERLERRLAALETARSGSAPAASAPSNSPSPPPAPSDAPSLAKPQLDEADLDAEDSLTWQQTPEALYQDALGALRGGQYADAEERLRRFLERYPNSDLADNAWFWIGESLFLRGRVAEAIEAYRAGIERYPTGNKTPDALYKLGTALASVGRAQEALEVWKELVRRFPKTEAAGRAREHLPGD
jgi:tol-pal system protein YbgF